MNALLILGFNKRSPSSQLKRAGYKQRPYGDWVRWETDGRWHINELQPGVFSLHFDLYVGDTHFAPPMPIKTRAEKKRILNANISTMYRMTDKRKQEINRLINIYK